MIHSDLKVDVKQEIKGSCSCSWSPKRQNPLSMVKVIVSDPLSPTNKNENSSIISSLDPSKFVGPNIIPIYKDY